LRSAFSAFARLGKVEQAEILAAFSPAELDTLLHDWLVWARDDQLPPASLPDGAPWRTWLVLGGRGAGKTRTGAEWVRAQALGLGGLANARATRIALIGKTLGQARSVMLEGISGLLGIHARGERPQYDAGRNQLTWPNGTIAQLFAADDPESLRGPQFDAAWCDELAKWPRPERAWNNLQLALRLGASPQAVVTTTPRALALLKAIIADPTTVISRSRTADNASNLSPRFMAEMRRRYAGTSLGRQELDGEVVDEISGGLWRREWIDAHRITSAPELGRTVVALDPPVTSNASSDACGIVVAAKGLDGRAYVLADRTIRGREPTTWARAAIAAFRDFMADRIVAEVNQGGDLVASVLHQIDRNVPVKAVRATKGKWIRAEPVAALYAEGRVAHVGTFVELEAQLTAFAADGLASGRSPDRLDALVWAITDLMLTTTREPTIRPL
jgi:phage terminase large subunit-like protein